MDNNTQVNGEKSEIQLAQGEIDAVDAFLCSGVGFAFSEIIAEKVKKLSKMIETMPPAEVLKAVSEDPEKLHRSDHAFIMEAVLQVSEMVGKYVVVPDGISHSDHIKIAVRFLTENIDAGKIHKLHQGLLLTTLKEMFEVQSMEGATPAVLIYSDIFIGFMDAITAPEKSENLAAKN